MSGDFPDPAELDAPGGRLLVASPRLADPNFERAVVLLLDHGVAGAIGVVINRPTHVPVGEILASWSDLAQQAPPGVVFSGGPVAPDAVIGVARLVAGSPPPDDWRVLLADIGAVDLSVSPENQPTPLVAARLFSGYAGWAPDQLEEELAEGSWLVLDAVAADVLASEPTTLWHDVIRRQGGPMAMLAGYPPDPSVN
ncbi:MAG: YqgE/AlgH family protein [Acidimicrobiales bacterium]